MSDPDESVRVSRWVCTRCGEDGCGPIGDLPAGWFRFYSSPTISVAGTMATPVAEVGTLCGPCTGDLHEWWIAQTTTVDEIRSALSASSEQS